MLIEDYLINHLKLLKILMEIKTESGVEIKPPHIGELSKEDTVSINDIYRYIVLKPKSWGSTINDDVEIPEVLDGSNGLLYAEFKFMKMNYRINFLAEYRVDITVKNGLRFLSAYTDKPKYKLLKNF